MLQSHGKFDMFFRRKVETNLVKAFIHFCFITTLNAFVICTFVSVPCKPRCLQNFARRSSRSLRKPLNSSVFWDEGRLQTMLGSGLLKDMQPKLFPCILQKVVWQLLHYAAHHALHQHFGVYGFVCSIKFPGSMSFADAPTCMGVRIVASDSQKIKNFG